MSVKDVMEQEQKYIVETYERLPVVFVRGQGSRLWDKDGSEYIDFTSGLGVCNIGHSHPKVVKAVKDQTEKLIHTSNLYYTEPQIELAEKLIKLSFKGKCFFANSGAEANEAAIKLARKYAKMRDAGSGMSDAHLASSIQHPAPYEIITALNSFHGRTLATLAATGQPEKQKAFEPLPVGFKHVPFNDVEAMKKAVSAETCAIMLETIQGEGGVHVAEATYLKQVRKLCDEVGLLLILDEVQTGIGRCGKFFSYEHYGIEPDMVTLAKSLGGGLPIGVLIAKTDVAGAFEKGDHGTTFGGNPLVCTAALSVLKVLNEENLIEKAVEKGTYLMSSLNDLAEKDTLIKEVRGKGLMIGIELKEEVASRIVLGCLKEGIVINKVNPSTLRLLPPLIVTTEEIDQLIETLSGIFRVVGSSQ